MKILGDGINLDVGLTVGEEIEALFLTGGYNSVLLSDVWLPMRIIDEYEKFFVCLVLPHRNPVQCWSMSTPYKLCVSKVAIKLGEVKVRLNGR